MKITVIGATGQIGAQVVSILSTAGHEVVRAARSTGADVLTGAGLDDALGGAEVATKGAKGGKGGKRAPRAAKYRYSENGEEKTWTGQGRMPSAMANAIANGATKESFLI